MIKSEIKVVEKDNFGTKRDSLRKKAVLEALKGALGVVSQACVTAGVARTTFYRWMNNDPQFKEDVESVNEIALDFATTKLFDKIKEGNVPSIIFYLKTQGKSRGFVEKAEIDMTNKSPDLSALSVEEIKLMLGTDEQEGDN